MNVQYVRCDYVWKYRMMNKQKGDVTFLVAIEPYTGYPVKQY